LGASKMAHLEENLKAISVYENMTDEVLNEIEAILNNKPVLEFF
jgi:aryl-alcohol dehydrogenase-like predicted oxidoreductase